ncbi:MAG: response regulator [Nannocystaceae bacterium]
MSWPQRVLYVEDDPTHVLLARRILERQGIEVDSVADGVEALTRLGERPPELVLVDLELPNLGGLALIRALRKDRALRDLPVVAVSASTVRGERRQALTAGADAFLEKPYALSELLQSVADACRDRRAKAKRSKPG